MNHVAFYNIEDHIKKCFVHYYIYMTLQNAYGKQFHSRVFMEPV